MYIISIFALICIIRGILSAIQPLITLSFILYKILYSPDGALIEQSIKMVYLMLICKTLPSVRL